MKVKSIDYNGGRAIDITMDIQLNLKEVKTLSRLLSAVTLNNSPTLEDFNTIHKFGRNIAEALAEEQIRL